MLSNEEAVQIIATAPTRAAAARSLVESAVRVWRLKYPTSKVDDCAVVCLYLDHPGDEDTSTATSELNDHDSPTSSPLVRSRIRPGVAFDDARTDSRTQDSRTYSMTQDSRTDSMTQDARTHSMTQETEEITLSGPKVPEDDSHEVGEIVGFKDAKGVDHSDSKRRRSLADWLDADEAEEWSALDGVTRVNSLMNLPRFAKGANGINSANRSGRLPPKNL